MILIKGGFFNSLSLFTLKAGVRVTSKEIFLSTFLFVVSFIATELMVSGLGLESPVYKFIFRIFFLAQYSIFIYFMFDYFEAKRSKNTLADDELQEDMSISPEKNVNLEQPTLEQSSNANGSEGSISGTAPAKQIGQQ
jgi:hypothetical protein